MEAFLEFVNKLPLTKEQKKEFVMSIAKQQYDDEKKKEEDVQGPVDEGDCDVELPDLEKLQLSRTTSQIENVNENGAYHYSNVLSDENLNAIDDDEQVIHPVSDV